MSRRAINHLKQVDPVLARVIERVGPYRPRPARPETYFDSLARAIIYQQLSGKAAATIHSRLLGLYGDRAPLPHELLATTETQLRAVGVSRQKAKYLHDLATKVHDGTVPLDEIAALEDAQVIEHLVQVKGIGTWTAHMFLMFRLGRPDVLPDLDLGIQNAVKRAYRLRKQPGPKDVRRVGAKWTPYSSIACWYLWRSLEVE